MSNPGPHKYLSSSLHSKTDIRWHLMLLSVTEAVLFACTKKGLCDAVKSDSEEQPVAISTLHPSHRGEKSSLITDISNNQEPCVQEMR